MFYGLFEDKADICQQFEIDDFQGVVVYSAYEYEDYSGEAVVIYVDGGKFWYVSGSHCSCYQLEGMWSPEEIPIDALLRMVSKGNGSVLHQHRKGLVKALEILSEIDLKEAKPDTIEVMIKLAFG